MNLDTGSSSDDLSSFQTMSWLYEMAVPSQSFVDNRSRNSAHKTVFVVSSTSSVRSVGLDSSRVKMFKTFRRLSVVCQTCETKGILARTVGYTTPDLERHFDELRLEDPCAVRGFSQSDTCRRMHWHAWHCLEREREKKCASGTIDLRHLSKDFRVGALS
jgi:hypothetical protein